MLSRPFERLSGPVPDQYLAADDHAGHLALIELAAQHSPGFEPLYRRYVADVYFYCFRRLDHAEEAADATSRTFTKALAGIDAFRPDPARAASSFRAWLFRIAHNTVVDLQRRKRPQDQIDRHEDDESSPLQLVHPGQTPEEHALMNEDIRRVRETLEALPERQRRIVELRLADLSGQEIADAMNMSLSAVKSAQFRAYQTLRTLLWEDGHPDERSTTT